MYIAKMDSIIKMKNEGNDKFKRSSKSHKNLESDSLLREACMLYAQSIEAVGSYEIDLLEAGRDLTRDSDSEYKQIELIKPQLFLNLGMTNAKLKDYVACRRCCNVAMYFCNESYSMICDMPSIVEDVDVLLPVAPFFNALVSKILFHRGRCIAILDGRDAGLSDLRLAHSFSPEDNAIKSALTELEMHNHPEVQSIRLPYAESEHQCAAVDKFAGGGGTVNGGLCLERTACWSQSLTDVTITIPICSIADECDINSANLKVDFKTNCLRVLNLLTILLDIMITGGNVIPCECTWYLSERQSDPREGSCLLLIVLSKQSPSAGIVYPGCEWWSHVFEGDERIETLTCSIGSDVQSLPQHARERRDREHARFCAMSLSKKEEELNGIKDLKLAFLASELNTRDAAIQHDKAIEDVPQRAEMLDALSKEFPHIHFSAK